MAVAYAGRSDTAVVEIEPPGVGARRIFKHMVPRSLFQERDEADKFAANFAIKTQK